MVLKKSIKEFIKEWGVGDKFNEGDMRKQRRHRQITYLTSRRGGEERQRPDKEQFDQTDSDMDT